MDAPKTINTEVHNIKLLLDNLRNNVSMEDTEFVIVITGISQAMQILTYHFTSEELYGLLKVVVDKLTMNFKDYMSINKLPSDFISPETLYDFYINVVINFARYETMLYGQLAGLHVLKLRHKLIEITRPRQGTVSYIHFLNSLAHRYEALNYSKDFIECHQLIIDLMQDHTVHCQPQECQYSDIELTYYALGDYKMAAYFLEIGTQKEDEDVIDMGILIIKLYHSYFMLGQCEQADLTSIKLKELHSNIKEAPLAIIFLKINKIRDFIIPWYRTLGMESEVIELEERLIESLKEIETITMGKNDPLLIDEVYRVCCIFMKLETTKDVSNLAYKFQSV